MSALTWIATGALFGTGVPWLGMRMFVPSLAASPTRVNFRGRPTHLGLGVVWVLWAGGAMAASLIVASAQAGPAPAGLLILAGPLALAAFSLGLIDDALGSAGDRGFGGHLRALAKGRLTTGMLKLIGISVASLVVAAIVSGFAPWGRSAAGSLMARIGLAVLAGAAIALTSNLLNLLDLRPGRALKSYGLLALLGALVSVTAWIDLTLVPFASDPPAVYTAVAASALMLALFALGPVFAVWGEDLGERAMLGLLSTGLLFASAVTGVDLPVGIARLVDTISLGVFVLGPALAVWRYDLGEVAMLGDAGANPMGVVAGLLIVLGLPLWALIGYTAVVFALNLASERISFSRVIEGSPVLSRLDHVGRRDM